MEKVVLIDAYSQIFRAFYAVRTLKDPQGRPVNALYIFTKLLLGIEKEYPGHTGAMLFDCGKVQFRLAVAPDYKANRPPMPDDLKAQMPAIREMAAAFGWPLLSAENYEADDLIGGFARACDQQVLIVTSDKDLSQLITPRVSILAPAKGSSGFDLRQEAEVVGKFGVKPELVADYLALVGDSSDNIPGVPGIGPKSAAALLNEFGAIETWGEGFVRLAGSKFAAKLTGAENLLKNNLILVRLKTELPAEFADIKNVLKRRSPDWNKIAALCREYAFNAILKDLPGDIDTPPQTAGNDTPEQLDLFAALTSPEQTAGVPAKAVPPDEELPEQGLLF